MCAYISGMATAPEPVASCPACQSSHTRKLAMLSELDSDFDFFMCSDCDHAWKEPKMPATPSHSPEQSGADAP
jgi:Zn ribbon nucleic-acid-binding protein